MKVSSVPGSTIVPERVAKSFSSIDEVSAMPATSGATLVTSTVVEPETLPVSSSVTVTLIGMLSTGVPVGSSSRNWWVTLNVPAETPVRVWSATLSPSQSIATVKVSSVPTSPIVPDRVVVPFSRIDVAARPVSVGSTLSTVTLSPVLTPPPRTWKAQTPVSRLPAELSRFSIADWLPEVGSSKKSEPLPADQPARDTVPPSPPEPLLASPVVQLMSS